VDGRYGIYVSAPDGSDARQLTDGANDGWPAWSPDGTRILFSSTMDDPTVGPCRREGEWNLACSTDLYVMSIDGSGITRITSDPAPEYDPEWAPDGTRIAYTRSDNYGTAIWVANADGSEARQVSRAEGGSDFRATWTPDGGWLVFGTIRREDWGIFEVAADGSGEHAILPLGLAYVDDPVVSPDGGLIAFVGDTSQLAVAAQSDAATALFVMRSDGGGVTEIAEVPSGVVGEIAWQPVASLETSPSPTATPSPSTMTASDSDVISVQGSPGAVGAVTYGFGSVWVASCDDAEHGWLTRIDAGCGDHLPDRATPTAMTTSPHRLAVLNYEGTLTKVGIG
jgi:Tol biopolymer transport system component